MVLLLLEHPLKPLVAVFPDADDDESADGGGRQSPAGEMSMKLGDLASARLDGRERVPMVDAVRLFQVQQIDGVHGVCPLGFDVELDESDGERFAGQSHGLTVERGCTGLGIHADQFAGCLAGCLGSRLKARRFIAAG